MVALVIGIVLLCFSIFATLPPEMVGIGLGWGKDVLLFLRGGLPIFTVFVGFISIFIGLADIKDKKEAKEEESLKEKK